MTGDRIVLPDGFVIPVQPGEPIGGAVVRHQYTAVGDGICPVHREALNKPSGQPPRPWCSSCGKWWWINPADQTVSWELMHDPHEWRGTA